MAASSSTVWSFLFHQLRSCLSGPLMSSQSLAEVCEIPHLTSNSHAVHLQKVLAMKRLYQTLPTSMKLEGRWWSMGLCSSQASRRRLGDGSMGTWRTNVRVSNLSVHLRPGLQGERRRDKSRNQALLREQRRFVNFKRQRHRACLVQLGYSIRQHETVRRAACADVCRVQCGASNNCRARGKFCPAKAASSQWQLNSTASSGIRLCNQT